MFLLAVLCGVGYPTLINIGYNEGFKDAQIAKPTSPDRPGQREEENLRAQKDLVYWAGLACIVAAITGSLSVLITAVGVIFVRDTLKANAGMHREAIKSRKISHDQLIASQRPWLKIEVGIADHITFNGEEVRIQFVYRVTNVGNYPASNIFIDGRLCNLLQDAGKPGFSGTNPGPIMQEMIYEAVRQPNLTFSEFLFPGEYMETGASLPLKKPAEDDFFFKGDMIWPHLICCARYTTNLRSRPHVTAFVREIRKATNTNPELNYHANLRMISLEDCPLPPDRLHIGRSLWSADHAD